MRAATFSYGQVFYHTGNFSTMGAAPPGPEDSNAPGSGQGAC